MKKQTSIKRVIITMICLSVSITSYAQITSQNIDIPEHWIHADSLRVRAIHVGDSSIIIGSGTFGGTTTTSTSTGLNTNNIRCSNGVLNFGHSTANFTNMSLNVGTQTTTYKLHLHDATNGSNAVNPFIHFTNTPTGQLTTDGFAIGISSAGHADLIQKEQLPMRFYTANNASGTITLRMFIQTNNTTNDGYVAIGNGFSTPAFRLDVNDNINVNSNTASSTTANFINAGYRIGGNLVLALPNENNVTS
jgi:hypothetical protein